MAPATTVWPVLHYEDTEEALRFLVEAFGFEVAVAARDEEGEVVHAEVCWPEGGRVVFGSTKHAGGVHGGLRPGSGACYVVTDGVDAVYERAVLANADVVRRPHETAFGAGEPTRAFSARDPEGNLWTFGAYRGAG